MILAAFHLAARRDRSTHQKQEPSDGYVSIRAMLPNADSPLPAQNLPWHLIKDDG